MANHGSYLNQINQINVVSEFTQHNTIFENAMKER